MKLLEWTQWDWRPYKKRTVPDEDRATRGERPVTTEAEMPVMQLQTEEHQGRTSLPETKDVRKDSVCPVPQSKHGLADTLVPDVCLQNWGEMHSVVLSPLLVVAFGWSSPRKHGTDK